MNYMNKVKYILHFNKLTITTHIFINQTDYFSTRIPSYIYIPYLTKKF